MFAKIPLKINQFLASMGRATAGASQIYCVRRAERSDSGVRVQRALRIFEKFIHIIPFLVGFLLLYLIFLF